jgi:hypothetical protein
MLTWKFSSVFTELSRLCTKSNRSLSDQRPLLGLILFLTENLGFEFSFSSLIKLIQPINFSATFIASRVVKR